MSISTEITRIKTNIANAYNALKSKGATLPTTQNSDNLVSTINSISSGTGQYDWYYNARTQNGKSGRGMFASYAFTDTLDLTNLDTSNMTSFIDMFRATHLKTLDLSNFNTSNVVNMQSMFYDSNLLTSLNLNSFDTSKVTSMWYMFNNCRNLTSLNLSNFNTSKVNNMQNMFYNCESLTSLNLSNFNTNKVVSMYAMFYGCKKLTSLDISNFDTSNVTTMQNMFGYCTNLINIYGILNMNKVTALSSMFGGSSTNACINLTTVNIKNLNYTGLNLSYCTSLSHDSLMYLINNLVTTTSTKTLTLGSTNLAKLTTSEKAIATSKGWTLG